MRSLVSGCVRIGCHGYGMLNRNGIQLQDPATVTEEGTPKKDRPRATRKRVENEGVEGDPGFICVAPPPSSVLTTLKRIWYLCRDSFICSNSLFIAGAAIYGQLQAASGCADNHCDLCAFLKLMHTAARMDESRRTETRPMHHHGSAVCSTIKKTETGQKT